MWVNRRSMKYWSCTYRRVKFDLVHCEVVRPVKDLSSSDLSDESHSTPASGKQASGKRCCGAAASGAAGQQQAVLWDSSKQLRGTVASSAVGRKQRGPAASRQVPSQTHGTAPASPAQKHEQN